MADSPNRFNPKMGDNWKVVVLSLLAATTFWLFNSLNKSYSARLSYPLSFDFDRDSVVIVQPLPDQIRIDVSGGGWNLLRKTFWFNVDPIVVELDNPTEVKYFVRRTLSDIVSEQLQDLRLDAVITDTLFISIEERIEKKVKVVVDSLTIPLSPGHRITTPITYVPDSVLISGPSSLMQRFPDVWLLEFDRNSISGEFQRSLKVPLTDPNLMKAIPPEVLVSFQAEEFVRDSMIVEVQEVNFPDTYRGKIPYLRDSTVQVFYTIKKSDQALVADSSFTVTGDFKLYKSSDSTLLPIVIYRPKEVLDLQMLPEALKVGYYEE